MRQYLMVLILLVMSPAYSLSNSFNQHRNEIAGTGDHYGYLLETGDDALLARLYLIRNARQSIDIQTFIWDADSSGTLVFAELIYAARRGVRVRILIDDLSLRKSAKYVAYLSTVHENIEIRQYNPMAKQISANVLQMIKGYALEFGKVNQRMHTKTFIVDGRFGISGGRNFADDYFDRGVDRSFKDRDLLVAGDAVRTMHQSFEAFWHFELSVPSLEMKDVRKAIEQKKFEIPIEAGNYEIPLQFKAVSACADNDRCFDKRIASKGMSIEKVTYVADTPGKLADQEVVPRSTASLWQLIESAQHSILLQTPYLIIGGQSIRRLKRMRKEKPDLVAQVSTNSLAASDHFQAYAYSYRNKKNYLKDIRLEIFEFKPEPLDVDLSVPPIKGVTRSRRHYVCVHSKTFVFDARTVWLGTFNLDRRSSDLNTEAGFVIEDERFALLMKELISRDRAPRNAWVIGLQRSIPIFTWVSRSFESLFRYIPFVNVWPFRYTTSYELKSGGEVVPFYEDGFYDNYRLVGQFPGKTGSIKAIETRLWKAFLGPAEPIF